MLAEAVPPKILPRILGRFDLVTMYFSIIFGSYGAAQLAAQGWAGIPMLLLAAVTFLLPCALASYELGTLFPSEGGIYVWTHKTCGSLHGFISGWLSWVPIFLLIPLDATIVIAHLQYALGQEWSLIAQVIAQIVFVWLLFALSIVRLRISQSVINVIFFLSIGTAIAAFIAGWMQPAAQTPVTSDIYSFDLVKYGSLYSAAVLWLLGVEVPFNMGAEYSDHKKTGKTMLLWGSVVLLVGYVLGITGILWSTPVAEVDQTIGIAKAVETLSPLAGTIIAVVIALAVFAQATAVMNAYSRLPFIGGIEKRLPAVLSRISKKGKTPWPAMLVQAVIASIVILIFSTQTQLVVTFNLYLAALVAVWCASLFYIYIALLRVRTLYPSLYRNKDVWKIPGGNFGLWLCGLWGIIFNALAIYFVFAKPWTSGISLTEWRLWLGITCVCIVVIGVVIFFSGKKRMALSL